MTWQLIFRFHSLTLWTWLPRAAPTSCMEFYFWTLLHALFTIFLPILFHVSPKVLKNQNFLAIQLLSFSCMYHAGMRLSLLFFQIFLTRDVFSINKYSKLEKLLQINEKCTPQDIISNNWISILKFRKRYVWESPNQKVIFVNSHVDRWTWITNFFYYRDFNMIQQRFGCFYWFLYYANKNENGGSNQKKKKKMAIGCQIWSYAQLVLLSSCKFQNRKLLASISKLLDRIAKIIMPRHVTKWDDNIIV